MGFDDLWASRRTKEHSDGTATHYIRVRLGTDRQGKPRREWLNGRSREALEVTYHKTMAAAKAGQHRTRSETVTFAELTAAWLPIYEGEVGIQAYHFAAMTVRIDLDPFLGRITLRDLTTYDCAQWMTYARTDRPRKLAAGSINRRRDVLIAALDAAIDFGYTTENVARKTKALKVTRRPIRHLTQEQAEALAAAVDGEVYGPLILLALGTGMRRGELLSLKWPQVNLSSIPPRLTVAGAIGEAGNGRRHEKDPKSAAGRRSISLAPDLAAYLTDLRAQQTERRRCEPGWNPKKYVCVGDGGTVLWPSNIARRLSQLAAALNLPPGLRLHELRHTQAALLIRAGVPMKAIQHRLGHSDIKITMNTYGFIYDEVADAAGGALVGMVPLSFRQIAPAAGQIVELSTHRDWPKGGPKPDVDFGDDGVDDEVGT